MKTPLQIYTGSKLKRLPMNQVQKTTTKKCTCGTHHVEADPDLLSRAHTAHEADEDDEHARDDEEVGGGRVGGACEQHGVVVLVQQRPQSDTQHGQAWYL